MLITLLVVLLGTLGLIILGFIIEAFACINEKSERSEPGYLSVTITKRGPFSFLHGWGLFSVIVGVAAAIIILVMWPVIALDTKGTAIALEAFQRDTLDAYEYTVDKAEQFIIIEGQELTDFSDESYTRQLEALRDKVDWYNYQLNKLRTFNNLFFIGGMVDAPADDLKPIRLK